MDPASTSALLAESSSLISDADLSIAALSLKLAVTLLKQQPAVAQQVVERVLPAGLVLVRSPLLQVRERWRMVAASCGVCVRLLLTNERLLTCFMHAAGAVWTAPAQVQRAARLVPWKSCLIPIA
jgi:hypothetical protein